MLPGTLAGKPASSEEFRDYAVSPGAESLLSVSYQWWHDLSTIEVRYEDLVQDGMHALQKIAVQLGARLDLFLAGFEATSFTTFSRMPNRHGWQGIPGSWKDLIPQQYAAVIADHHRHLFKALGYGVLATGLTSERAQDNWVQLLR